MAVPKDYERYYSEAVYAESMKSEHMDDCYVIQLYFSFYFSWSFSSNHLSKHVQEIDVLCVTIVSNMTFILPICKV